MKICITAQGDNLDAKVESHFGRSPCFIIYDTESSKFEAIENHNIEAPSGVGILSGQLMADKKVEVVLTGGKAGLKASQTLAAAGIKVITVAVGTVRNVIEQYQSDNLIKPEEENDMNSVSEAQNSPLSGSWFGRTCWRVWRVFGGGRGAGLDGGRGRRAQGRGMGIGYGLGRGQGGGRQGFVGPSGYCVCPSCEEKVEHFPGVPCRSNNCPKCGTVMVRE